MPTKEICVPLSTIPNLYLAIVWLKNNKTPEANVISAELGVWQESLSKGCLSQTIQNVRQLSWSAKSGEKRKLSWARNADLIWLEPQGGFWVLKLCQT